MSHVLRRIPGTFAVVRLEPGEGLPGWLRWDGALTSVTRTDGELSIICDASVVPAGQTAQRGFAAWEVQGPLAFDQVGVLSSLSATLAAEGISLLAISTHDTDFFLVRATSSPSAEVAWRAAGHRIA